MKDWIVIAVGALASLLFMALVVWVVTRMIIPDCIMYVVTETRDGKEVTHLECRQ